MAKTTFEFEFEWHKYPDDKPPKEYRRYLVVFLKFGELRVDNL